MMHVWTPEETEFLVTNYHKMSGKEIAKVLGLKYDQVKSKIARLKLRKWKEQPNDNGNL